MTGLFLLVLTSGGALACCSLYLLILAVASFFAPRLEPFSRAPSRLAVLVPAHNEAALVQRCIRSLMRQDYPADLYEVIVIADNCTDETASLSRAAGARVMVRIDPSARGKGQALRWAIDRILNSNGHHPPAPVPDAFVIVDADSVAHKNLLSCLAGCLESGAEAAQAEYLVLQDASSNTVRLRAVAFLLFHRVRFSGRAALRLPCHLVGNGMLLSRPLVERYPWNAFTAAEDLEYSINLRLHGVRPVFCRDALVWGPMPRERHSSQVQRERWEGGRIYVLKTSLPPLLKQIAFRCRFSLLDAALDLIVPPLGLMAVAAVTGSALSSGLAAAGLAPIWVLTPWAVSVGGILGYVTLGMISADAPMWMYRSMLSTPIFLLHRIAGIIGVIRSRPTQNWIRTERPNEVA